MSKSAISENPKYAKYVYFPYVDSLSFISLSVLIRLFLSYRLEFIMDPQTPPPFSSDPYPVSPPTSDDKPDDVYVRRPSAKAVALAEYSKTIFSQLDREAAFFITEVAFRQRSGEDTFEYGLRYYTQLLSQCPHAPSEREHMSIYWNGLLPECHPDTPVSYYHSFKAMRDATVIYDQRNYYQPSPLSPLQSPSPPDNY